MAVLAVELLDASPLCAIATVSPGSRAHVNTAYFAWSPEFEIVWVSDPGARHSRNLSANATVALAVFASDQAWGESDRGIQLFGSTDEAKGNIAERAEEVYASRFQRAREVAQTDYRLYVFRPRRVKLFDERALGAGVCVTAKVATGGRLAWEQTDVYRPGKGARR